MKYRLFVNNVQIGNYNTLSEMMVSVANYPRAYKTRWSVNKRDFSIWINNWVDLIGNICYNNLIFTKKIKNEIAEIMCENLKRANKPNFWFSLDKLKVVWYNIGILNKQ